MAERIYERDEGGKFGSGGGGGAAPKEHKGREHGGEHHAPKKPEAAPGKPEEKAPPRTWTDKPPAEMRGASQTWQSHFTGDPEHGGQPLPERAKLHEGIYHEALAGKPTAPPGQRIAVLTMGGTGAGKSTGGESEDHLVRVDPDKIKTQLPEWHALTNPNSSYKKAASAVHEESSHAAKELTSRAIEGGHHVLVDGTGANPEKMNKLIQRLHDNGYRVHLQMTHTDPDVAHPRALGRAETTGRLVDKADFDALHERVPHSFMQIKDNVDSFDVRDNNRDKDKGGARLVWSRSPGKAEQPHESAWVGQFSSAASRGPGHVKLAHLAR